MATPKFIYCIASRLSEVPKTKGNFIMVVDTNEIYVDYSTSNRVRLAVGDPMNTLGIQTQLNNKSDKSHTHPYAVGFSVSGQTVIYAKGDGTTGTFTTQDSKVTSVGNHYTPSGGSTISASDGSITDITNSTSGIQVITGITKDAAGHVTGITSKALKSTKYAHPTTSGYKHIPSGGSSGQILDYSGDGTAKWATHYGIDIGRNTYGKTYTVNDISYTGSSSSEVFNFSGNSAASNYSHAEGCATKALATCSHAEGSYTTASGDSSHAEGDNTTASGDSSHAEGYNTTASSSCSHAEGRGTTASGNSSHAEGFYTKASSYASHACGKYNKAMSNSTSLVSNVGDVFVIGNGTSSSALSNAFRITYAGATYGLSAFNSSGADYAEFIKPWFDNNPNNEDRVGYFVTIKNSLLYKANEGDYIVGITSGNPSIVGNADEDYYWRYERDDFNRFVYEDIEEEIPKLDDEGCPILDENGKNVMIKTGNIIKNARYKLAEDYDPSKQNEYVERKDRPEWSYVGMIGVIPVRDDGTCEPGKFCKCGKDGIATLATDNTSRNTFFVIERISDNIVSVEMR